MVAKKINHGADTSDREILITRVLNAPRELVFQAWTDPKHVGQWWGPRGFSVTTKSIDLRPQGEWIHVMHGPDGRDYPNKIIYMEIVKPELIVYRHANDGETEEVRFQTTVTFSAVGDKTSVTVRSVFESAEELEKVDRIYGARDGAVQHMDRLTEKVAEMSGESLFVISRTFNAPRELIFKLWTDPEQMREWWGPKGCKVMGGKMDLRPGGVYHYGMQMPDGVEMWGKFIYREVAKPERLVFVDYFSDEKGGITRHPMSPLWPLEMLTTITFLEDKGKTTVTIQLSPLNATDVERKTFEEGRGSMLQGWTGTLDQLTEYVTKNIV
jgi:uncharacterized protein YndB with AHSA1/START domain